MKSKSFYLFAAFAFGLVVMIIAAGSLAAQVFPGPDPNTVEVPSAVDNRPPTAAAGEPDQSPQRQPLPPIGPGFRPARSATQYFHPVTRYPSTDSLGVYQSIATPLDAKTQELVNAYLTKQIEISQLVKKYGQATDEGDRNLLRDEIVTVTTTQFDLRQQVRAGEIEQLKSRLADVESTVQKRNDVKDQIVEKRVADILREPDQLGWEPLGPNPSSTYGPPSGVQPPPLAPTQATSVLPAPRARYMPRTVVKYKEEVIVDAEGNQKVVRRPVSETVYDTIYEAVEDVEELKPSTVVQSPFNDHSPDSALQPTAALPAVGYRYPIQITPSSMQMTVAEAEARVRIAKEKRDVMRDQLKAGVGKITEMIAAEGELELANLGLGRANAEYEARTKLLELDVRQATAVYDRSLAALNETNRIKKSAPGAISSTQEAAQQASVQQAQIGLERAKTILEIHQKSNVPQKSMPQLR